MLRTILFIIIIFLLVRYISAALRGRDSRQPQVKGKPPRSGRNIPEDRIQDANYKDLPDK